MASLTPPVSAGSFLELFTPKTVTVLREGYGATQLRADVLSGLTVAIVALPLSMAIAIASGASPAQGLYTAIVGGFFVSALGGSRFQIGGPAGAFIVLVAATAQEFGMSGVILATLMAGLILMAVGLLRLGTYIKFIPYPVTVGFTAGIAVIILASQLKEFLGLTLSGPEPGPILEKLPVLWRALPTADPATVMLSAGTVVIIVAMGKWLPRWPGMLVAVAAAAVATSLFGLQVGTIGTKFGGIPSSLPVPHLPDIGLTRIHELLPSAVAFALLGAIESLLSAVVADGMTGRRHRSNCELVAQGVANVASSLFGGICVTGTIARTATNVRSGAHGPMAGMFHSGFLLLFVLVAAPLASSIPLASLAGVLAVVAWKMIEKHAFATLLKASRGDGLVLLATLGLTVFRDLTEAIVVGFALGSVMFIHRMSQATSVVAHVPLVAEDRADTAGGGRPAYDESVANDPDVVVFRIVGAFFFGAAASIGAVLERISDTHRLLIIDLSQVPFLDSTAANMLEGLARKVTRRGVKMVITGAAPSMGRELHAHRLEAPLVDLKPNIEAALADHQAVAA